MPHHVSDLEHPNVPSVEEAHAELDAVLRSPAFERSERLQRFLRYICELTLKGEGARINEYLIGSEVFQRGATYSPSEDSIVRRQALSLRQKLQEYYATEGRDHAVRIELPVGRYVPTFRSMDQPAPVQTSTVAPVEASQAAPRIDTRPVGWNILLGCLLFFSGAAVSAIFLGQNQRADEPLGPAVREIWGPWLQAGSEASICFSNPMTAVIKHFERPLPPDALPKRFRAHPQEETLFRQVFRLPPGGAFYYTPVVNQTKMGEAIAGIHLSSLLTQAGVKVKSAQSRFLGWNDLRNENYILLGHNEANHWLEPILSEYPLRLV
ncbi:MAG: hypothetical protein ACRD7E_06200, partial [Bryobacteraceae bacterium]